jgi:hypothetical protein
MSKISKFVKLDKNVLLEYIYNDGNLVSEAYNVLVNSRERTRSYLAYDTSGTNNIQSNSLFRIDAITGRYGKINPSGYNFLQVKNFSAPAPIRHDVMKVHIPVNWTFGEYLGFYVRVYAFDTTNQVRFDLSNFYFDMTDVGQSYLLNYTAPPLLFQEKLWGKTIQIEIPSLNQIALQLTNNLPTPNSINANLTNGVGLNMFSPIFIDFQFIKAIQTVNAVTTYLLDAPVTTSIPQTPEFENLGLKIEHSPNGDFFEIYGTYNDTISGFKKFIDDAVLIGSRYYVQYDITLYEQNIRGKTLTITVTDSFNETIEYRPIIKFTTTTAIIDVEMRLIDAVDESSIIRKASYGMLQDEVSKYSINLTKINLSNASKPKIYNIKNAINPSLVGVSNSMGMLSVNNVGKRTRNAAPTAPTTVIQTVEVPFPVLIDRFNIMAKSENATLDAKTFYGYGKLQILIYPFDNVIQFVIASGTAQSPVYLDLSRFSQHQLVFRTDQTVQSFPIFLEANDDLSIGNITFKIPQAKYAEIKKIYNQNVNVFYITATSQQTSSVIYTGLFKVYDNAVSVAELNQQAGTPGITLDDSLPKETAIVTRRPIREMLPTLKPSNMKNNSLIGGISNIISNALGVTGNTSTSSTFTEYVTQSQQTAKALANAVGMPVNDFANINNIQPNETVKAKSVVKVPSNLAFKTAFLVPKKQ